MTKYKISYSFQLRKHDFRTKKYGQFSIINKCLSDWNQLQKHLKTNFKDIKRSELKTIVTNHLLKQYITQQNYERKTEKICLNYPSLSSISLSLSKHISLFVFYDYYFLFFPSSSRNFYSQILWTNLTVFIHHSYLLHLSLSIQHIQPSGMPSYFISDYYKYCSH